MCITGWNLVSQSSRIKGFQDIKMRLPKLFKANFSVKMMEFQWYSLSMENWQRLAFQLLMNQYAKRAELLQTGRQFFERGNSFKLAWTISNICDDLSQSNHLCKSKLTQKWNPAIQIDVLKQSWTPQGCINIVLVGDLGLPGSGKGSWQTSKGLATVFSLNSREFRKNSGPL